ncbi:inositol monophosphatase family protein [Brenneria uluponensis]|uniref:inositol monophosphatase family protein n=1 Tax=Brenneria uluponensis TaxID=3057057 RepID=UPI0028EA3601|nr:inositol monophosphatase family protein [Brenneria ulupoensis]
MSSLPDICFLHQLAALSEDITMKSYRQHINLGVTSKLKEGFSFDPVTDADRATEKRLREYITLTFPNHAILGEEYGRTGSGEYQWVIDPIDGTRPFLCGLPVWGTLIGLIHEEHAVMGMMSQPFTRERFWSDGEHSWTCGPIGQFRIQTRKNIRLHQAILHSTSPESIALYPNNHFEDLSSQVLMTRFGGECYAMAMLAAGYIDICVEYSMQPYDIVPLIPIIETAGGIVTTIDGGRPEKGGAIVTCGSPTLHAEVLQILNATN